MAVESRNGFFMLPHQSPPSVDEDFIYGSATNPFKDCNALQEDAEAGCEQFKEFTTNEVQAVDCERCTVQIPSFQELLTPPKLPPMNGKVFNSKRKIEALDPQKPLTETLSSDKPKKLQNRQLSSSFISSKFKPKNNIFQKRINPSRGQLSQVCKSRKQKIKNKKSPGTCQKIISTQIAATNSLSMEFENLKSRIERLEDDKKKKQIELKAQGDQIVQLNETIKSQEKNTSKLQAEVDALKMELQIQNNETSQLKVAMEMIDIKVLQVSDSINQIVDSKIVQALDHIKHTLLSSALQQSPLQNLALLSYPAASPLFHF